MLVCMKRATIVFVNDIVCVSQVITVRQCFLGFKTVLYSGACYRAPPRGNGLDILRGFKILKCLVSGYIRKTESMLH